MNPQLTTQGQNLPDCGASMDYDALARLAQDDPAAYEEFRLCMINRLINAVPSREQQRLRGLQFQIDQMRALAHTSLGATVALYSMMWRSFISLNNELSGPRYTKAMPRKSAKVISFRRAKPADISDV